MSKVKCSCGCEFEMNTSPQKCPKCPLVYFGPGSWTGQEIDFAFHERLAIKNPQVNHNPAGASA